ncbi:MAG: hypothetical protein Q9160_003792 [Pyrenula sp. 1 TL-2023]
MLLIASPSVVLTTISSLTYLTTTVYVTQSATTESEKSASTASSTTSVNYASPIAAVPPILIQNPGDRKPDIPAAPSTQAPSQTDPSPIDISSGPEDSSALAGTEYPKLHQLGSTRLNPDKRNTWAMAYSQFDASSKCKPSTKIQADVRSIAAKGFSTIRIYSPECSILPAILPLAKSLSLRIILGIYVHGTDISGLNDFATQIKDTISAMGNNWDTISLVTVANESLDQGILSIDELLTFISIARSRLQDAGYNGPVSTAESLDSWSQHSTQLCGAVDVAAANIQPFFDPETIASSAGDFVQAQLAALGNLCPGKDIVNLETGWPHAGNCNQQSCPGAKEQQLAVDSLRNTVGAQSVFLSFEDELWKDPGEFEEERSWGCGGLFNNVKQI